MVESEAQIFSNYVMDRSAMRRIIGTLVACRGTGYAVSILEQLKELGFEYATRTGISLGIDDLLASPAQTWLVQDAQHQAQSSEERYECGCIHAVEKLNHIVETWHTTSEFLKREMSLSFEAIQLTNPVHMMSFSGARGSTSQVHQLLGMRGLMSNPQGSVIDLPIQNSLRGGLSLPEYVISCYGARKGVIDTAIRTADAGYLTRRLVEVAQHFIIHSVDCGTFRGVSLQPIEDEHGRHYVSPQDRLVGRVLARAIYVQTRCIAARNQEIDHQLADRLATLSQVTALVRSPLTCKQLHCTCQLCYGWSSHDGELVQLGEAVGIIAGQSIGEPGTQLTLRTFHTGGVFTGEIANYMRTPSNGVVCFEATMCQSTRNHHGRPAWQCSQNVILVIQATTQSYNLAIPYNSLLYVVNNQYVSSKQVVAETRMMNMRSRDKMHKKLYSSLQGELLYQESVRRLSGAISNLHLVHAISHNLTRESTCHTWVLAAHLSQVSKRPVCGVHKIGDSIQIALPIARRCPLQIDDSTLPHRSYTQFSAMLSRQSTVMWHRCSQQIGGNVAFETQTPSVSSGVIHSVSCAPAKEPQALCFLTLSAFDQFAAPLQPNHNGLKRSALFHQIQPSLRTGRATATKRESITALNERMRQFTRLGQVNHAFCHSAARPMELLAWSRGHIPSAKVQSMLSKGIVGCPHSPICYAGLSSMNANIAMLGVQAATDPRLSRERYRMSEHKRHYAIDDCISKYHQSSIVYPLVWPLRQAFQLPKLGQLWPKSMIDEHSWQQPIESGRLLCISDTALQLRLAQCHLVVAGTLVYGYGNEGILEQQALFTLLYEQVRASDIIQGLPKAERLFEAHVNDDTMFRLERHFSNYKEYFSHLAQPYILSAEKSLEIIQIDVVDQIQAVYLGQGVRISDKHVELIIRQSSKMVFLESGFTPEYSPALLPGELVDLERAQRMGKVFQVMIEYKPILAGITRASLDAESFLAAASFERTVSVLSTSALKGRTDWMRGLQENVIFGGFIPAGTGCEQIDEQAACFSSGIFGKQSDRPLGSKQCKQSQTAERAQLPIALCAQDEFSLVLLQMARSKQQQQEQQQPWAKLSANEVPAAATRKHRTATKHKTSLHLTCAVSRFSVVLQKAAPCCSLR